MESLGHFSGLFFRDPRGLFPRDCRKFPMQRTWAKVCCLVLRLLCSCYLLPNFVQFLHKWGASLWESRLHSQTDRIQIETSSFAVCRILEKLFSLRVFFVVICEMGMLVDECLVDCIQPTPIKSLGGLGTCLIKNWEFGAWRASRAVRAL